MRECNGKVLLFFVLFFCVLILCLNRLDYSSKKKTYSHMYAAQTAKLEYLCDVRPTPMMSPPNIVSSTTADFTIAAKVELLEITFSNVRVVVPTVSTTGKSKKTIKYSFKIVR